MWASGFPLKPWSQDFPTTTKDISLLRSPQTPLQSSDVHNGICVCSEALASNPQRTQVIHLVCLCCYCCFWLCTFLSPFRWKEIVWSTQCYNLSNVAFFTGSQLLTFVNIVANERSLLDMESSGKVATHSNNSGTFKIPVQSHPLTCNAQKSLRHKGTWGRSQGILDRHLINWEFPKETGEELNLFNSSERHLHLSFFPQ